MYDELFVNNTPSKTSAAGSALKRDNSSKRVYPEFHIPVNIISHNYSSQHIPVDPKVVPRPLSSICVEK